MSLNHKGSSPRELQRLTLERQGKSRRVRKGDQDPSFEYLITLSENDSPAAEAFRTLRTNLLYAVVGAPPSPVMITSPNPREGKSVICANLGVVLAQAGKHTLIVDCDLRAPNQQEIFGLHNNPGMVNVLAGDCGLHEALQEGPVPDLSVLTVGPVPPNPTEVLGTRIFAELLDRVSREFEYVLVDAPPTQPVSDALILASQVDGVLLVIDSGGTRKETVRRSMRSLETVGANLLGTVMNNMMASDASYYGGGTYGHA